MDRLRIPSQRPFPTSDFTIEGFILCKSNGDIRELRTIAAQWEGIGTFGWRFGVTGPASGERPQNLFLHLRSENPLLNLDYSGQFFDGIQIEFGKPYFVAASVRHLGRTGHEITLYAKDLSNDDQPLQVVSSGKAFAQYTRLNLSELPLMFGASDSSTHHLFHGLLDDIRLSNAALPAEELLINNPAVTKHTVGYWKFERDPGEWRDSSPHHADIAPPLIQPPPTDPRAAALTDLCHVLLNSNEFLYMD